MANTINDLYLKYVNRVGRSLENDRYFQYLFEMIQAGEHTIKQHNRLMHKVVDERWIEIVEQSLDAINNIIDKPRRFIATNEQLVPVELARKISSESVRHLSRNTQFISTNEQGDVMPSKILNVTNEESYDLYENRFIYHLIQRLVTFIDKRTDIIFWSTGDEKRSRLSMESTVEDGYEEINYKIEMVIKNRQSFAENDADNIPIFMRIDRVRRLTLSLRDSAFCSIMHGCAKVHSPIQRTNLMMKDPDYRTCYKLWQFLESYDEIGYTIEEIDTALEFDEEYLIQLYTNLITNYTVFKSLLEGDERDIFEAEHKKRRKIKPKFIKTIKEEIVEDYDIPDVEIRKVLIEEVTQAQLDAEAKVEELTKQYQELEEVQKSLEDQIQTLYHQINAAMDQAQEAGRRAFDEQKAKEEAQERIVTLEETISALQGTIGTLTAEQELAAQQAEELVAKLEALEEAKAQVEVHLSDSRKQCDTLERQKEVLESEKLQMAAQHAEAESLWQRSREEAAKELEQTKVQAAEELQKAKQDAKEQLQRSREEAAKELEETKAEAEAKLEQTKAEAAEELERTKAEAAEELERAKAEAAELLEQTKVQAAEELQKVKQDAKERQAEAAELLRQIRAETMETLLRTQDEHQQEVAQIQGEHEQVVTEIRQKQEQTITEMQEAHTRTVTEMQEAHARTVAEMQEEMDRLNEQLRQMQADALVALEAEKNSREAVEARLQKEHHARVRAEERAEGNRISKLLGTVIRDRKLSEDKLREQIKQELEAQKQEEPTDNKIDEEI